MKANLARYGVLALNLLVLVVIQWSLYRVFFDKKPPAVQVHRVDLKGIAAVWRQPPIVPNPAELTGPIRDAFGERAAEVLRGDEDSGADDDTEEEYQGPLQFVGLAFAPAGGRHIVHFEYNGDRASYVAGDELPDGKILDSVDRAGEGKYVIRFRVKDSEKIEQQTYEVEQP